MVKKKSKEKPSKIKDFEVELQALLIKYELKLMPVVQIVEKEDKKG